MTKRVLMIAYHFPPFRGSSGAQRTVQFARYLPRDGWEPMVLTVRTGAYPDVDALSLRALPDGLRVERAWGLDTAKHLAWRGRYLEAMAIPDRWASWWVGGVSRGLSIVKRFRPHALWSSFPIATAHWIGLTLHRLTGLPWVADFRDPMLQPGHPVAPLTRAVWKKLEASVVHRATRCVLVTPGTLEDYRSRYPEKQSHSWAVIENGYEEGVFEEAQKGAVRLPLDESRPFRLLHSGILYAEGRNPQAFFNALRSLVEESSAKIEVVLRGPGEQTAYEALVEQNGLRGVVKVAPPLPYTEAIREMLEADGLLLFQGAIYNRQIPAKAYEYLRSGRPILALTDTTGDTARLLQGWDGVYSARMDSEVEIRASLSQLLTDVRSGSSPTRAAAALGRLSRQSRAQSLARLLDAVTQETLASRG